MHFPLRKKAALGLWCGGLLIGSLLWLDGSLVLPQTGQKKQPVPDKITLDRALEKLQTQQKNAFLFAQNNPKAAVDLANQLMKLAEQTKVPGEQYVFLQEAWKLAAGAGDLNTAFWAIDAMEEAFVLNGPAERARALAVGAKGVKTPEGGMEVVDQALKLITMVLDEDDYDLANVLGQAAEDAARKTKDLPLVLSVQRERKGIDKAKLEFAKLKPFVDRLKQNPSDPEANLQMGKYLCFFKGNWERGLFYLAQSSDPALRMQAQRDLIHPEEIKEQIGVGDAWWEMATKEADQTKTHIQQRAVFWYQQAIHATDGLVLGKLEQRIAAVPPPRHGGVPWDYSGPPGPIRVVGQHFSNIYSVAFSPDGQTVASGSSDSQAILWDVKTGNKIRTFIGHTSTIWALEFDPKGKYLYTSSWDGTARKWEISTGKELQRFPPNNNFGSMYGLALSPNGKQLLTGVSDSTVRLWDTQTGQLLKTMHGHKGTVYGVAFGPDGRKAVSSGSFDRMLIWWDLDNGTIINKINNAGTSVRYVAVSPDGQKCVASGEVQIRLWDLKSGKELRKFAGHQSIVYALAFSPDGKRLVTGGLDRTIRYWDVNSGKMLKSFDGHNSTVYSLAFSPGGGRVVSGSFDNSIRLWGMPR